MQDKEKQIELYLVRRVKATGGLIRKITYVAYNGCPDRLVLFPGGKIFFVELKTKTGLLSLQQLAEHAGYKSMGVNIEVLKSRKDVDDFIKRSV